MPKKPEPTPTLAVRFNKEQKEVVATGLPATVVAFAFVLAVLLVAYLRLRA